MNNDELIVEAENRLARSRAILKKKAPYLMRTIYGFIPIPELGWNTMGVTEGMVLVYGPEWILKVTDEKIAAALYHESQHILRDHLPRMAAFPNRDLANIAADLAINPDIRAMGWVLPHGVFPEDYGFPEGLTLEEYYFLLIKRDQQRQQQQKQGGGGQGGGGSQGQKQQNSSQGQSGGGQQNAAPGSSNQGQPQPQGSGGGGSSGSNPPQPGQDGQGGGNPNTPDGSEPQVCAGRCGGCAGKEVSPREKQLDAEIGRSSIDRKRIVKQTMEEIKEHAKKYGRGTIPGGLLQAIDAFGQESEVPWEDELRYVTKKCSGAIEAGGADYSLARPSKRSYARGFPRPGMVQYQPEAIIIVDTSLSMGKKQLEAAVAESIAIFRALGLDSIWLMQADAAVAQKATRIRLQDLTEPVEFHGRGGTDFDPALRAIEELKPKPDLAIYITDGDGHVSYQPRGIEVVWCIVRSNYNKKPLCDWGHTVIIADNEKPPLRTPRTA